MTTRKAKPGCKFFSMRDVPIDLLDKFAEVAASRGQTLKSFILEACRREVDREEQRGRAGDASEEHC